MSNPNYDAILSSTLANHRSKLIDNVFTARPLVWFLKQAGQIETESGGHKIVRPIVNAANTTTGSYAADDVLPTQHQGGITAAEYEWRQFASSINIWGIEEAKNAGEEAVFKLLQAKITQAEESILEEMDEMFLDDGTGNGGKDWNGLKNLVAQNATSVGGIDPATYAYWQSNITALGGALTIAAMNTIYNTSSVGSDAPNMVLTTQTLYEKYESLLQPNLRYQSTAVADGGFQNLLFKSVPVLYDTYVDSGYVYFLNTKYIKLIGHSANWFKPTPFVRPFNADYRVAQILCYGNLVIDNRKRQGVLTGATA